MRHVKADLHCMGWVDVQDKHVVLRGQHIARPWCLCVCEDAYRMKSGPPAWAAMTRNVVTQPEHGQNTLRHCSATSQRQRTQSFV